MGMAQALVCPEAPMVGCGRCAACTRVTRFHHPDVLWLMPEDESVRRKLAARSDFDHVPSREIRVDQVRRLQERLALRPLEAPRKVVLLLPAEAMNPQAQNAFLKTLEEPPPDTVLLLVIGRARPPAPHLAQPLHPGRRSGRSRTTSSVTRSSAGWRFGGAWPRPWPRWPTGAWSAPWPWTPSGWWTGGGASSASKR